MSRALKYTLSITSALLLAVVWYFFAPTQIGGQASYVTIRGVSMQPLIKKGDLVILRKKSHYEVGDIAAYRSSDIHQLVLHRIIARDGERYVMRGDNTQGPDREQPLASDFVGERWIQLDGMGTWLQRARDPQGAALLAGLAVLLTGGAVGASHSKRRRKPKTTTPPLPRRSRAPASTSPPTTAALVACGLIGGFSLLLALVAFTRAPSHQVSVESLWQQKGVFAYQAKTTPGFAYPNGRVRTEQPVFVKLIKRLAVSFSYGASSTRAPLALSGKASLAAIVQAGNGWTRRLELAPARSFEGGRVKLAGTLDLARLEALRLQLGDLVGIPLDSIQVVLQPSVIASGSVAETPIQSAFSPTYTLRLDSGQLTVETQGPTGALTDNTPLRTETVAGTLPETRHVSLKLFSPTVSQARLIAAVLLLLSIAGMLLVWLRLKVHTESDEPAEIERKYGQLLVPVSRVQADWDDPVEVESIEALVHLAERYDRAILHVLGEGVHHYMVEEDGSLYRYVAFDGVLVSQNGAAQPQQAAAGAQPPRQAGNGSATGSVPPQIGGWEPPAAR